MLPAGKQGFVDFNRFRELTGVEEQLRDQATLEWVLCIWQELRRSPHQRSHFGFSTLHVQDASGYRHQRHRVGGKEVGATYLGECGRLVLTVERFPAKAGQHVNEGWLLLGQSPRCVDGRLDALQVSGLSGILTKRRECLLGKLVYQRLPARQRLLALIRSVQRLKLHPKEGRRVVPVRTSFVQYEQAIGGPPQQQERNSEIGRSADHRLGTLYGP